MSHEKLGDRKEWLLIQDLLADALEKASDQELLDDLKASGTTKQELNSQFSKVVAQAKLRTGKLRLAAAQRAVKADKAVVTPRNSTLDSVVARVRLKQVVANDPSMNLMLAARNAGSKGIDSLSDEDVQVMLEMAADLGHLPPNGSD